MIPGVMDNYFLASAGAGAVLVGLIFIAISLWPRENLSGAPPAWRAVAGGSFFAFINAFLVSLSALNPGLNPGLPILLFSLLGIANSLLLGFPLLRSTSDWKEHIPNIIASSLMVFASFAVYAGEGYFAIRLLLRPDDAFAVEGIVIVLLLLYALGLIRAWELLGVEQIGLRRWLNPLRQPGSAERENENRGSEIMPSAEHE